MSQRIQFINKDLYYYYAFLIIGLIFIFVFPKAESFLILNRLHSPLLDRVMPYVTFFGDGFFAAIVALFFLIYRIRYGIYLALTFISSGIIVQFLKRLVFEDKLRPVAYFNELAMDIYTIPAYDTPLMFSFPSGHSTTAFACFVGISFLVKQGYLKLSLTLIAILAGYSRVYLAVHFPVDVIAGSLIGVLTSYIFYHWVFQWKKSWLDVSLGSRIIKPKLK